MSPDENVGSGLSGPISWPDFLVTCPPGGRRPIKEIIKAKTKPKLVTPTIQLPCDECDGIRNFDLKDKNEFNFVTTGLNPCFLLYLCRNCGTRTKLFAVLVRRYSMTSIDGEAIKLGEEPFVFDSTEAVNWTKFQVDLRVRRRAAIAIGVPAAFTRAIDLESA